MNCSRVIELNTDAALESIASLLPDSPPRQSASASNATPDPSPRDSSLDSSSSLNNSFKGLGRPDSSPRSVMKYFVTPASRPAFYEQHAASGAAMKKVNSEPRISRSSDAPHDDSTTGDDERSPTDVSSSVAAQRTATAARTAIRTGVTAKSQPSLDTETVFVCVFFLLLEFCSKFFLFF